MTENTNAAGRGLLVEPLFGRAIGKRKRQIRFGGRYKTRDGLLVRITQLTYDPFYLTGFVEGEWKCRDWSMWGEGGKATRDADGFTVHEESSYDLVEELDIAEVWTDETMFSPLNIYGALLTPNAEAQPRSCPEENPNG